MLCLITLPEDVHLQILLHLDAPDLLCCQLVSRSWRFTFSSFILVKSVLKRYSNSRELRTQLAKDHDCLQLGRIDEVDWTDILRTIGIRYSRLSTGTTQKLDRIPLKALDQEGQWQAVGQWDYHESQPGGRLYYQSAAPHLQRLGSKAFLFRPTLWTYDNGIVVYPSAQAMESQELVAMNLETNEIASIPFLIKDRIIRNLRLCEKTLIVEWAERVAYHDLTAIEKAHRHFATCFDVLCEPNITVKFRNEWKLHFLGLPLSQRDHFFSVHTRSHYAWYLWQPNRSLWTGDEDMPIEALSVWDISAPNDYLPSKDPTGRLRPNTPGEDTSPYLVARYGFRELEWLGVRQHGSITLMSLKLDSDARTLTFWENVFQSGQGYFDPAERVWRSATTTFPFDSEGPCLQKRDDIDLPPYRGHCSMESAPLDNVEKWFTPIMDVYDKAADVRFSLIETCFTGSMMENKIMLRIKNGNSWVDMSDRLVKEIGVMGRIAGDERWLIGQNARMELLVARFQ